MLLGERTGDLCLKNKIQALLKSELQALYVEAVDESGEHAGHAAPGAHFSVLIVSELFEGKGRLERHRMVHDALRTVGAELHALRIRALSTSEWKRDKINPGD